MRSKKYNKRYWRNVAKKFTFEVIWVAACQDMTPISNRECTL
jgi:hypothetical protein